MSQVLRAENYSDIILNSINLIKLIKPSSIIKEERRIKLVFISKDVAEKFMEEFNQAIFPATNNYIKNTLKENPKDFNRVISITSEIVGDDKGAILTLTF